MLVSLFRSLGLLSSFVMDDLDMAVFLCIISHTLPKYLVYRRVVVLINKCIQLIDAEIALQPVGPPGVAWSKFKKLASNRHKELHYHRDMAGSTCGSPDIGYVTCIHACIISDTLSAVSHHREDPSV